MDRRGFIKALIIGTGGAGAAAAVASRLPAPAPVQPWTPVEIPVKLPTGLNYHIESGTPFYNGFQPSSYNLKPVEPPCNYCEDFHESETIEFNGREIKSCPGIPLENGIVIIRR